MSQITSKKVIFCAKGHNSVQATFVTFSLSIDYNK